MEGARLSDTELGEWLRRKGLTEEHLRPWRGALEERAAAVFEPREPRVSAESRRRVQELEQQRRPQRWLQGIRNCSPAPVVTLNPRKKNNDVAAAA